jgi:hypothetical protein
MHMVNARCGDNSCSLATTSHTLMLRREPRYPTLTSSPTRCRTILSAPLPAAAKSRLIGSQKCWPPGRNV